MTVAWFIGIWLLMGIVTIFILMLELRLHGYDEWEVYDWDEGWICIMILILVFAPLVLALEIIYILFEAMKKYMVALIEVIIAYKKMEEEKPQEVEDER